MKDILFPKNKVHGRRQGNIAMCGKQTGRHSTKFGMLDEITCGTCLRIINKKFDMKRGGK